MRVKMSKVINGKRYSTETATVIASNAYWDGSNYERTGTNRHLYRTINGSYFEVFSTCWEGARNTLEPLSLAQAKQRYQELPEEEAPFEEAFPGEVVEEA